MKYALAITGVLAAVVLALPQLVVLGFVALVVPGLILMAAPTVFLYLAATALVRRVSPADWPTASLPVALVVTLLGGWAVMQPARLRAIAAHEAQLLPEVKAQRPLEIAGHVRLELPQRREVPECDYLCAALLTVPEVQSVTVVNAPPDHGGVNPHAAAFKRQLAAADASPGLFPTEPGRLVREHPQLVRTREGRTASKAVEAQWALRLTGAERLRSAEPVAAEAADWVLRIENRRPGPSAEFRRVTISDSTGAVRFRTSYLQSRVPARQFYVALDAAMGFGSIYHPSFQLGCERLGTGDRALRLEPALLAALKLPLPRLDAGPIERLRERVEQALADPTASTVELESARHYLGLFFFDAQEDDHPLIARIVTDERVRDLEAKLTNVYSKTKTPLAVRDAFAERIVMEHCEPDLRHWLAERLAGLPAGAFAEPTVAVRTIWSTPALYREAAPLIARVADQGPERATPVLVAALETAVGLPTWRERRALVEGVREGFVRLGPGGAPAAARVHELFLQRPSPLLSNAGDADDWRFALTRMGVAIDDLPFFPSQSPADIERISRHLANRIARYEQALANKNEI
ncbi:hypothetical protein [Botrimarina hoheduenensis]|uniref:Uncharacterized protein n=1 Tax=Botrimarina hoheduenensis TaxID=2528000 RepID=A0A5C5VX20_9BACT|nr:hypothetical protein [Botrimarina hoheduenensis]TWT43168.1 hypothetical protein Pla111_21180 [Botrimarina hoheduenensis]